MRARLRVAALALPVLLLAGCEDPAPSESSVSAASVAIPGGQDSCHPLTTNAVQAALAPPIAAATPGASATPAPPAGTPTSGATAAATVSQTDGLVFQPADVTVKVGDVMEWKNTGSTQHNVVFGGQPSISSQTMQGGATFE